MSRYRNCNTILLLQHLNAQSASLTACVDCLSGRCLICLCALHATTQAIGRAWQRPQHDIWLCCCSNHIYMVKAQCQHFLSLWFGILQQGNLTVIDSVNMLNQKPSPKISQLQDQDLDTLMFSEVQHTSIGKLWHLQMHLSLSCSSVRVRTLRVELLQHSLASSKHARTI